MLKFYSEKESQKDILMAIKNQNFNVLKTLKDDQRSKVYLVEVLGNRYVYKVPTEKNKRVWQRFLSIFRGSESKREFDNYNKILNEGFKGPKGIGYFEKKIGPVVVDSFLVSSFLDGRNSKLEDLSLVEKELRKIHDSGYLHGDSQLSNFMIVEDEIYLIDAKMKRNIYGGFGASYEFIYLEESCHKKVFEYDNSIYYRGAKLLNEYLHFYGKLRKKIKNFFRGKEKES
ncbi:MAG: lipopolysaccharide core heptose(II) kinase RfaY [Cetobacterium sp.]|uniref:lipopolysaccharide core heptose(II) kinase RfaY n=1 Tax=Cetobacterium sp. TaxID=2071632 RepID=UPI002FC92CA4